jgi:hypothetical protein
VKDAVEFLNALAAAPILTDHYAAQARRAATLLQQQQHLLGLACAELDHMGAFSAAPAPAVVPVAVSARPILKSSSFNNADGHCWCGTKASVDATGDLDVVLPPSWELREPCSQDDCLLPHNAIPLPQAGEVEA